VPAIRPSEIPHLTIKEAADILGVSPNTLRAWGAAGKIPEGRHPVNNYRLYRRDDVEALRRRIETAVPVDAVFLSLHGAAAAQEPALRARFLKFLNGGKRAQHKRPLVENAGTHFELSK